MKTQIKELFADLNFEEISHTYTRDNKRLPSASAIVSRCYEKFDAGRIAPAIANKRGIPTSMVLQEWEDAKNESIKKGNLIHLIGELIAICKMEDYPFESLVHFWLDELIDAEVLGTEVRLYSDAYQYAGTADLIVKKPRIDYETGEFLEGDETIIFDYKTNKDLYKNYKGKRMKAPFDDMLDTPYSHYVIQQNLYKIALEEKGVKIDRMVLVWTRDQYELVEVPDITDRIKEWLHEESTTQL